MKLQKMRWFAAMLTTALLLSGCSSSVNFSTTASTASTAQESKPVNLVAMKGPTGMGIVKYAGDQAANAASPIKFRIETLPEEVVVGLAKGTIDVAAIPANLAATLFQKMEGGLQVAAINVTNVLYFAENGNSVKSLADLKGKTIYSTGKAATPEATLSILLKGAGLTIGEDVDVVFSAEASEVGAKLASEAGAVALLQEPFLTSVRSKNAKVSVPLSVGDLWQEQFGEGSAVVTGVLVARKAFIAEQPQWVEGFLAEYKQSVDWVNANPTEASKLIESYGIIDAATAQKAIPQCGITLLRGQEMKGVLSPYLNALYGFDPKLIGGAMPTDDFYYLRE